MVRCESLTDVVVITLNSQNHLQRCLESVVREIPHARLIVVDGGSTDRTVELAKSHGALVLTQERPGLGEARRIGLAVAKSPIMAMVDSDIALPKGWFAQVNQKLRNDHVVGATGCVISGDPGCRALARYSEWRRTHHEWTAILSNALVKTALVHRVGGFNPEYQTSEDVDLLMRVFAAGLTWVMVEDLIVRHPRTFLRELAHIWWWSSNSPRLVILGPKAAAKYFLGLLSQSFVLARVDFNLIWMWPLRSIVWMMGYLRRLTSINSKRRATRHWIERLERGDWIQRLERREYSHRS